MKYQRNPQTNLQIRIIKKKSLRGRKDFQCRYVYQYLNFFSCVIGKATIIVNIPEVLCWILKLFLGDSADVGYTVDDSHHIRIDIQFHDDKTLFLETGEKEGKVKKKDGK